MKKLLFLLSFIFCMAAANAQLTMTQTDPSGATSTINTNGDTSYHDLDLAGDIYNFKFINLVLKGTKNSGTISGGTAIPYGSMDGSRWFQLYGKTYNSMAVDTTSSRTLTNGDTDFNWLFTTGSNWRYYRIRVITTGTQTSTYIGYLMGRKEANR